MKKLLPLALLALCSCATITASGDQDISIVTDPTGAHCSVSNTQQSVSVASTPGLATVKRMYEPLNVECTAPGYRGEAIVEAKTRGRAYGNILLLGVPALVDASTGKGYEYAPDEVFIKLTSVNAPVQPPVVAQPPVQ